MKNSIFTGIIKLWEKVKKTVHFHWPQVKPALRRHGDILLFLLALAVLAAVLLNLGSKKTLNPTPSIVFTQWWQEDLEDDTLQVLIKEFESLHGGIKIEINTKPY